jgi:regulator of sigma E protease
MLTTIGALIVVLGVLIFVHELGHFIAAKAVDIAVLRFSLGFGPLTPLRFRRGETEYCVSWVPLGGYVKMAGLEDEGAAGALEGPREEAPVPPERTFDAKPLWARIVVISAGVVMNVLFAVAVHAGLALGYGVARESTPVVGEISAVALPPGARSLAGLRPGDRIVRINGDSITGWADLIDKVTTGPGAALRFEVAGRAEPLAVDIPVRDQEGRAKLAEALVLWHEPVVGDVVPGHPAAAAGLQRGDRILRINGDTVRAWERLVAVLESSAGEHLRFEVQRGASVVPLTITPESVAVARDSGRVRTVGKIGAGRNVPLVRYGPIGALGMGARMAAEDVVRVVTTLKLLVTGQVSPKTLGGPILIGQISGEAARLGAAVFLGFMALMSVNLAVLNILPIPVLDGGHLLFLLVEGVRRRPLSLIQRQRLTNVGFFLLVGIMLLAIANDLQRVLPALLKKLF